MRHLGVRNWNNEISPPVIPLTTMGRTNPVHIIRYWILKLFKLERNWRISLRDASCQIASE
jgi:hypothetical protein